jgi:hypothetical protein
MARPEPLRRLDLPPIFPAPGRGASGSFSHLACQMTGAAARRSIGRALPAGLPAFMAAILPDETGTVKPDQRERHGRPPGFLTDKWKALSERGSPGGSSGAACRAGGCPKAEATEEGVPYYVPGTARKPLRLDNNGMR